MQFSIDEIIDTAHKTNYINDIHDLFMANSAKKISNKDWDEYFEIAKEGILESKYLVGINLLTICMYSNYDKTFVYLRKTGLLRYSTYNHNKTIVPLICKFLLLIIEKLNKIDKKNIDYLNSIITIEVFHKEYQKIYTTISDYLKTFRKQHKLSPLKSLLAYADSLFLIDFQKDFDATSDLISSCTKEEITEAISFIIFIDSELFDIEKADGILVFEKEIKRNHFMKIILQSCLYKKLQEVEILIEHYNYICVESSNELVIVSPLALGKAISLGFIANSIKRMSNENDISDEDKQVESIVNFSKLLIDDMSKLNMPPLVKKVFESQYPKYVIQFNEGLIEYINDKIFKRDELLLEEIYYLNALYNEQLVDPKKIKNLIIEGSLTVIEFMKFKRWFLLMQRIFYELVYEKNKDDYEIILRSLVTMLGRNRIYTIFSSMSTKENIDSFLKLSSWDKSKSKTLDIQYHPLIHNKKDDYFLIPINILASSSTLRNLYSSEMKKGNKNLLADGNDDYLLNILEKGFRDAGFDVYCNVKYRGGDIDLLAVYGTFILIAECKNSLLPTSAFELRTTYDYVKKANHQLDNIIDYFGRNEIKLKDNKTINSASYKIQTAVILNSRMFYHWPDSKHPIRYSLELLNFIESGVLEANGTSYNLWDDVEFNINDLKNYLSTNNKIKSLFYNSLTNKKVQYKLSNNFTLSFNEYHMKIDDFILSLCKSNLAIKT